MKRVGIAALTASLATYGLYKRKEIIHYKKPEDLVTKTDHMAHAYVLDIGVQNINPRG